MLTVHVWHLLAPVAARVVLDAPTVGGGGRIAWSRRQAGRRAAKDLLEEARLEGVELLLAGGVAIEDEVLEPMLASLVSIVCTAAEGKGEPASPGDWRHFGAVSCS